MQEGKIVKHKYSNLEFMSLRHIFSLFIEVG